MTPELIGILAVGATLIGVSATMIGLLLAFWRDARADTQALRVEVNAGLADVRADNQRLRTEVRADFVEVRADFAQVRGDLADVRTDVQALTERVSRLEGVIEGLFARPADRDRHDDAA